MVNPYEAPRDTLKAILAEALPDQGPRHRLEIYARQSGFRSDASLTAAGAADNPSLADLSRSAAEGRVLPLMVAAALPHMQAGTNRRRTARPHAPRADKLLQLTSQVLDQDAFRSHLHDPLQAARAAGGDLPRYLFALMASETLLVPIETEDRFWFTMAARQLCATLCLALRLPEDANLRADLRDAIDRIPEADLSPWERKGKNILGARLPDLTQESIFLTMVEGLA